MTGVFTDTLFWVASLVPGDPWAEKARAAKERLPGARFFTTEEVLVEVLTTTAGFGAYYRNAAAELMDTLRSEPTVEILPQTHETFETGLRLYRQRLDKAYSMVDCISMVAMKRLGIRDVLTNDHHFEQEGFTILIR